MTTIRDIAKKANVSIATVSNVIHGNTNKVSEKTIEKIEKIMEEMHYTPSMGARILSARKSKIIGVVCTLANEKENHLKDPFTAELLGALEKEIRLQGYYMMLYASDVPEEIEKLAAAWNVDGMLFAGIREETYQTIRKVTDKPIVLIDSYFDQDIYNVGIDDERGGYEITRYVLKKGHRKIAFSDIESEENLKQAGVGQQRFQGFLKALREYGIPFEPWRYLSIPPASRWQHFEALWNSMPYTAIIFTSDYAAAEAIHFFQSKGMKVPDDISITGFDDVSYAEIICPRLTTIQQEIEKKGSLAVQMLLQLIAGENPNPKNIHLPIKLVIRDSVKDI